MNKHNIVLIGFRGVGKTMLGRVMAKEKNLPFADLDEEVEFVLGESIDSFVKKHGWQVFREVEQKVSHDFTRNFSGVVATGAGTIENSKNLQNLKKTGTFVFLNPDFMKVRKFLMSEEGQENRPRLYPEMPIHQEIDQMWNQRKDIYSASSDLEVCPDFDGDVKTESAKIWEQIGENLTPKSPPKKRVAIFSSSNGTTFQGLLNAQKKGRIPNVEFVNFVTDKPKCKALEIAKKSNIKNINILEPQKDESREDYDRNLINIVRENQPNVVILAGWMKILSDIYCNQFGPITLNAHPSLLPEYAGMVSDDIHQAVLEDEQKYTGTTIHRVVSEVDAGEIFVQRKVLVEEFDNVESLRGKVQRQEVLGFCEALEHLKK